MTPARIDRYATAMARLADFRIPRPSRRLDPACNPLPAPLHYHLVPAPEIVITGPTRGRSADCEAVLRSLPEWFGIESSLLDYARSAETMPTFVARVARPAVDANAEGDSGDVVGFLTIKRHFPSSAEVYAIAVHREQRGRGIGGSLLRAAERWLRGDGVRLLQVKTLGASRPCPHYDETRGFYTRAGFLPLEEFPTLWSAANPCLVMVKTLIETSAGSG